MSAISIISSAFFFCSRNLTRFPWLSGRSPGGSDVSGAQVARLFASNQTQDRRALVSTFSSTSVPHSPFVFKHSPTLPLRHMLSSSIFVLLPTNISIGCLRTLHMHAVYHSQLSFSLFRFSERNFWIHGSPILDILKGKFLLDSGSAFQEGPQAKAALKYTMENDASKKKIVKLKYHFVDSDFQCWPIVMRLMSLGKTSRELQLSVIL